MITPFKMYLITMLNDVDMICGLALAFSIIITLAGIIIAFATSGYDAETKEDAEDEILWRVHVFAKKVARTAMYFLAATSLVGILTPTTKEMAAIIVVPKIANSETVAELGDGIKTLAVEWMEELRPKKEESK